MLLVIAYSADARQGLRNCCDLHEESVVGRFGRAALLESTEFAAFQAVRLRERYGPAIQVERTEPFNEFEELREPVQAAARAYADREQRQTPYAQFAADTDHPDPGTLKGTDL